MSDLSRRDFLALLGKLAAGGLLAFLFGKLFRANRIDFSSWESCSKNGYCPDCTKTSGCGLPQAQSYRKVRTGPTQSGEGRFFRIGDGVKESGMRQGGTEAGA